jgi:SAM-dependent methyltransferase
MPTFEDFDTRGYRMVDARSGYAEWVDSYEDTVEDAMDLALLDALAVPDWATVRRAADLGCGTGRTGAWLRTQGVGTIDGVDLTPEMLERARARGAHDTLAVADVAASGLASDAYDLVISSLVDEHLDSVGPLYAEAFRLAAPGACFVLVSFHPHFIISSGMPTHFTNAAGEDVAITTNVHMISDQIAAGLGTGFVLAEMRERLVDDEWIALKPSWERHRHHPVSAAYVWRKPAIAARTQP